MGIIALQYQSITESPLLLALNREERIDRPATPLRIQAGHPRYICGIDQKTGGTWAGVNQYGLFAAICNAEKLDIPAELTSRGTLCKAVLCAADAAVAAEFAKKELMTAQYAGCHILVADRFCAFAVHGGDDIEVIKLTPGLHILSESKLDDFRDPRQEFVRRQLTLQNIDSAVSFFAVASRVFSKRCNSDGKLGVIRSKGNVATVSSMMVSLTERVQRSVIQFSNGSPDVKSYEDASALLRQVLSTEKAVKAAAAAKEAKANPAAVPDVQNVM